MDSLDNTQWDVVIVGTGLQQSLLALYVTLAPFYHQRRLTDAACEEPCLARERKSFTLMKITTMEAPKQPLA